MGCYIWYSDEGTLFAVPNVTAHPSTANVPMTVLQYSGPLLCGFSVGTKGLNKKLSCRRDCAMLCVIEYFAYIATHGRSRSLEMIPFGNLGTVFSQPSIYIDGWLYGMRMTSVVCNVPVLSQNDSTYHHSVFTT